MLCAGTCGIKCRSTQGWSYFAVKIMAHRFDPLKCGEFLCLVPQRFCLHIQKNWHHRLITRTGQVLVTALRSTRFLWSSASRMFPTTALTSVLILSYSFSFFLYHSPPAPSESPFVALSLDGSNSKLVFLWQRNSFFSVCLICFHLCSFICTATDFSCASTVFH